jgi:hypothetical protein
VVAAGKWWAGPEGRGTAGRGGGREPEEEEEGRSRSSSPGGGWEEEEGKGVTHSPYRTIGGHLESIQVVY